MRVFGFSGRFGESSQVVVIKTGKNAVSVIVGLVLCLIDVSKVAGLANAMGKECCQTALPNVEGHNTLCACQQQIFLLP